MYRKELYSVIEAAEALDWNVTYEKNGNRYEFNFQKYSPEEQDFNIYTGEVETIQDLVDELFTQYECYDASEAAYLWLDNTGHGTNGAPYEMIDVYNDMKACEEMLYELQEKISNL